LHQFFPFSSQDEDELQDKLQEGDYTISVKAWKEMTFEQLNFLCDTL